MPLTKVTARGQITLPRRARRLARIEPGDVLSIDVLGPGRLQLTTMPRLSPRELRNRYPIEGPVAGAADREAWQANAADDVFGQYCYSSPL